MVRIGPFQISRVKSVPPSTGTQLVTGAMPFGIDAPGRRVGTAVLLAYREMPWLRAVVDRIATSTGAATWELYAVRDGSQRFVRDRRLQRAGFADRPHLLRRRQLDGTLVQIEDHPMLDLLQTANDEMSGLAVRRLTQQHIDLVGEAYWIIDRNALGMPVAIWPVPPPWVLETPEPGRPYYRVKLPNWEGQIPASEIVSFVHLDPANPYGRPSGLAGTLSDELDIDEFAAKHVKAWFYNGARPDLIVSADGLNPEDVRQLETGWLARHQGFWKAFRPFFANRQLDVREIGQSFESMQLSELREDQRNVVVQTFGLPPELLGILNDSNRATITMAEQIFARWVLVPRLEFLRIVMQERLAAEFDDRLIVSYVSPVPEDAEYRLDVAKAAPWSLTVDEWREMQGRPPLPDGAGAVFVVPVNVAVRPALEAPAAADDARAGGSTQVRATGDEREPAYMAVADQQAEALAPVLVTVLDQLRQHSRPALLAALRAGDAEAVMACFPWEAVGQELRATLRDALWLTVAHAGQVRVSLEAKATRDALVVPPLDMTDPAIRSWVDARADETAGLVEDASRAAVAALVAAWIMAAPGARRSAEDMAVWIALLIGLTGQQMQRAERYYQALIEAGTPTSTAVALVTQQVRQERDARAGVIADDVTLTAAAMTIIWRGMRAEAAGVVAGQLVKIWEVQWDTRVCEECLALAGQARPLDALFDGGYEAPPAHTRCRCWVRLEAR